MALQSIPEVALSSGNAKTMPVLGLGTGGFPHPAPEAVIKAVLEAIELGYRMFDTASFYQTEEALGEAISQAISLGLIKSRDQVFLTSKVEMNPAWQQGKLKEFCQAKGIKIAAFSPLGAAGAFWGTKGVLESEVLNEIAKSKGKSVAQVALRWAYEQGVVIVMKSFNKDRLKQNQEIFDWELSAEESKKIAEIPQSRANRGELFVFETGPIKSVEELWDGEL